MCVSSISDTTVKIPIPIDDSLLDAVAGAADYLARLEGWFAAAPEKQGGRSSGASALQERDEFRQQGLGRFLGNVVSAG